MKFAKIRKHCSCSAVFLRALPWLFSLTVLIGCGSEAEAPKMPPPPVVVTPVAQTDVAIYGEYVGETESPRTVELRARVEGFLVEMNFKEGSLVKKDDLLFVIDPRQYVADYQKAKAQLARDEASLLKARQNLARFRSLHAKDAVSTNQLENAITHEREMEATRSGDLQAVAQAKLNLSFTKIYAPLSGRIGRTEVRIGALVGKGEPTLLATISQVDPIYVNASISERDYLLAVKRGEETKKMKRAGKLGPEKDIKVTMILADDSMYPYGGTLNFVDRTVDRNTSTLPVRLEFPNPQGVLRPGQFARLRVVLEDRKNALLIPQRAVLENMEGRSVFVLDKDNTVASRRVIAGPRHGSQWVIEQGLQPGEQVIVEGLQRARPGIQVNPTSVSHEPEPKMATSPTPSQPPKKPQKSPEGQ